MRIALILLIGASGASAAAEPGAPEPILTELAWTHESADKIRILTERPDECLRETANEETARLVEIGRTAFNSPLLFGGQAARAGLSCNSCHINGRDNPDFFLTGLSGWPGEADVTSSVFSATREDGVFNPAPIPSLAGVAGKAQFGARKPAPSLHAFIADAVIDEFQGAPPPPAVIDGLAAYVEHLGGDCADSAVARDVSSDMADIDRIVTAAAGALRNGDGRTADFLIVSAQAALGRVHERYQGSALEDQRRGLRELSASLALIRQHATASPDEAQAMFASASTELHALTDDLNAHRRQSLYDVNTLKTALEKAHP